MSKLHAFQMDDETVYAGATADEAIQAYHDDTGELPEDGYPTQMSDAWLDESVPEYDENEAPTGNMTTMRAYLDEMTEAGFLCGQAW